MMGKIAEQLEKILNEVEGLVYLQKSEDEFDRTHADVMANNHKASALVIEKYINTLCRECGDDE